MQIYREKSSLLKSTVSLTKKIFPDIGINKLQELTRLVYEISKKESVAPESVFKGIGTSNFDNIKQALVKRRFPYGHSHNEILELYLPKLKETPGAIVPIKNRPFSPKRILVESSAKNLGLIDRFSNAFPKASVSEIASLKAYLKVNRDFDIKDYNKRTETIFVTKENYDFFKICPCTKYALKCSYSIFNLSFGCIFDCAYCYLQEYVNTPGLIFPSNLDNFFKKFDLFKKPRMRIGTGEFSDSLMLDHITAYSIPIIGFFKNHLDVTFEFKTKSINIENLLKAKHSGNIVASWSLNPQKVIDESELHTASLEDRLMAAKKCVLAGYKIGIHFDPILNFHDWEKEYGLVIDMLFNSIKPKNIAWISLGTLRFNPKVKVAIEQRFPDNKILDGELLKGFDNKLRYPLSLRKLIYEKMLLNFQKHSKKLPIYLCMEDISIWNELKKYLKLPSSI